MRNSYPSIPAVTVIVAYPPPAHPPLPQEQNVIQVEINIVQTLFLGQNRAVPIFSLKLGVTTDLLYELLSSMACVSSPRGLFFVYTSLLPAKARQVHGIHADGKIFMELLGCLACLYSWVGEPCMLQAACLSVCLMSWPLLPSMASIMAPVPLCVSHHHHPQQGVPTCLSTRGEQSQPDARNYTT